MAYSITTLKGDLQGILHGTTNNQITNLNGVINRAARQLLLDVDPQETQRYVPLTSAIYGEVYDYALPADLKGNKIIDIRQQVQRIPMDNPVQEYGKDFDLFKSFANYQNFTVKFNTAVKTLRLDIPQLNPGTVVNQADTVTGNGTWSVGGTASNLTADAVNFISPSSSLMFDLAAGVGSQTGYLENSTFSSLDLTNYLNQGANFWWSFLPTATNFTNMKLRLGSDSANYYEWTVTTDFQTNAWINGWNQQGPAWLGATVVGTPDITAIGYCRVTWTYDGTAQTGVRLNEIVTKLGSIFNLVYYSKYLFRSATTGAFQETVTSDTNLVNLDTESYNLLLDLVALFAVQQQFGANMGIDDKNYKEKYDKDLTRYKAMYKSEVDKPASMYYKMRAPGMRRWLGYRSTY